MEEEYRLQKAQGEHHPHGHQDSVSHHVIHEDGSILPSKQRPTSQVTTLVADANGGADDDASVRGVKESPTLKSPQASLAANDIPTIRISTESDGDRESEAAAEEQERQDSHEDNEGEEDTEGDDDDDPTEINGTEPVVHDTLEKPIQAAADNSSGPEDAPPTPTVTTDAFSFSNKRLCERWLDNLFMVLYEVRLGVVGSSHRELNPPSGSASLDYLQGRSRSLQNSAHSLQEDWDRVGDPRRSGAQTEPQRRGKGGLSKMPRFDAILP